MRSRRVLGFPSQGRSKLRVRVGTARLSERQLAALEAKRAPGAAVALEPLSLNREHAIVIGMELTIESVSFVAIGELRYPSLAFMIVGHGRETLIPYGKVASSGDCWPGDGSPWAAKTQFTCSLDAFAACRGLPITFDMACPTDSAPIGRSTVEARAHLCDAIANGEGRLTDALPLRNAMGAVTAEVRLVLRILCYGTCVLRAASEEQIRSADVSQVVTVGGHKVGE